MKYDRIIFMDPIVELLSRGVDTIYPSREALEKVLRSGKKLRLYQGFDPSGIQLHIGHMVGLMKLRQFQRLGHDVIFLIGDGTGQAGDPSGKTRTREAFLTNEQLRVNAKEYVLQASKVVDFKGKNAARILYNGDWLNKLDLTGILEIAGHFTLQQLEERDLYQERKKNNLDINFREFLYPLLQGYDSVAMKVDLEIGGSDQTFNMLAGRKLVREMLGQEKFVLTTPLLTDSSGKKIGKTEGNVIALTASPNEFFGMIMSLPDSVIVKGFEFLTDTPIVDVKQTEAAMKKGENPMKYKKQLAFSLTRILNNEKEAKKAREYFEKTFQKKTLPTDIPVYTLSTKKPFSLTDIIVGAGITKSRSDAKRLIQEGAVELNGEPVKDANVEPHIKNDTILKVGKHRFIKLVSR